jgi:hypothetical protein
MIAIGGRRACGCDELVGASQPNLRGHPCLHVRNGRMLTGIPPERGAALPAHSIERLRAGNLRCALHGLGE